MSAVFKKCGGCGRIFGAAAHVRFCEACLADEDRDLGSIEDSVRRSGVANTDEIASRTGLSVDRINQLLPNLADDHANAGDMCLSCRVQPAFGRSNYCLACQLGNQLARTAPRKRENKSKAYRPPVWQSVNEKRRRTGSHRFDPVPRGVK